MFKNLFGKYRFLVISITLFLIFDLGVLVLNFYTSGKIAQQAELINLAGRQRTLTQQLSKATLYIKAQKLQQWVYQSGLDELRNHYSVFKRTLDAFHNGGLTPSTETGELILVNAVIDKESVAILREANILWAGFDKVLEPLMTDILITDDEIKPASEFIAANNLILFDQMNRLTERFAQQSEQQTNFLRMVQVGGISLATINFFVILFHFLGQLKGRDRQLKIKQNESDQILSTIDEGVFLIDQTLTIGGQHSRYLETLFCSKKISGQRLARFFAYYFSEKTTKTAIDFIKLYYASHVNPDLIDDLNPLKRVSATIPLSSGEVIHKYLNFSFAKIQNNTGGTSVLVTVKDITDTVLLEKQAEHNEGQIERQLMLFSEILPIDPLQLDAFLNDGLQTFEQLNSALKNKKQITDNFEKLLIQILRGAHTLKGNASALNFNWFAEQLHSFETEVETIKKAGETKTIRGRDLLPITVRLKKLYESIETICELRSRLMAYGIEHRTSSHYAKEADISTPTGPSENQRWFDLKSMADDFAKHKGVKLALNLRGFDDALDSNIDNALYPVAVQLVRNSIAHGIENIDARKRLKKPDAGQIVISISSDAAGNYRFLYEDDGRGFDYVAIRKRLLAGGFDADKIDSLSKADLVRRTFSDRFSTSQTVSISSGRGVGLPIVGEKLKTIGASMKIRSVEKEFTQFIVDFSTNSSQSILKKAV